MNNSQVYALIPARSGSEGIIDKNILNLAGYPLLAYSIVAAKKCALIDRVLVSTDSEEYAQIAIKFGAEVPFIRPKSISKNSSTDLQFFQHAIEYFRRNEGIVPEYFAHLRPTSPIRFPEIINKAVEIFIKSDNTALRSVHQMSDTSYKTFEIENQRLKTLFDGNFDIESTNRPRQSFPITYNPNGYIDIVRSSMIDKGFIHGNNVYAYITDFTHDIDEQNDLDFLDFFVTRNSEIVKNLFNDFMNE